MTTDTSPWWARYTWGIVAFIGGIGLSVAAWVLWSRRPSPPDTRARESREGDRVAEVDHALMRADEVLLDAAGSDMLADDVTEALADIVNARATGPGR